MPFFVVVDELAVIESLQFLRSDQRFLDTVVDIFQEFLIRVVSLDGILVFVVLIGL